MSERISPDTRSIVAARASDICEYCLIAEEDSYYRHQIEHIISRKHGGSSELANLALSCVNCNRSKGSDVGSVVGPDKFVRFYNPRTDDWGEHFRLQGVEFVALTPIGEATIRILQMNHEDRRMERTILARTGRYPSASAIQQTTKH